MKILDKINMGAIFISVIKCFIMSCGVLLLLLFFNYDIIELTRENVKNGISLLFPALLVLRGIVEVISNKKQWVSCGNSNNETPATMSIGLFNEDKDTLEYNKRIQAIHEAGHAVMAYLLDVNDFYAQSSKYIAKVEMNINNQTIEEIKKIIMIKYSGAIAEELILGNFHAGCMGNKDADFEKATKYIKEYIVMTNPKVSKTLLDIELSPHIIKYSNDFYQEAKVILSKNKKMIEILSDKLREKEFLNKNEIVQLLEPLRCIPVVINEKMI